MLNTQLSACRVDIRTMLLTNRTTHSLLHECIIEYHGMGMIHSLKAVFIHSVVGNQIHIGIQTL